MRRRMGLPLAVLALAPLATGLPQRWARAPVVEVPFEVPAVDNPARVPAWRFVGPRTAGAPCGEVDRARLLRDGAYAWRVVVVTRERIRLPDGTESALTAWPSDALAALQETWRVADATCGELPDVLFVVDGEAPSSVLTDLAWHSPRWHGRPWLLVRGGDERPARLSIADVLDVIPAPANNDRRSVLLQLVGTYGGSGDAPASPGGPDLPWLRGARSGP